MTEIIIAIAILCQGEINQLECQKYYVECVSPAWSDWKLKECIKDKK